MGTLPDRGWLLLPAGAALIAGLDGGLLRLGVPAPVTADRLMDVHGPLLVLGFLGTLVALERAVALRQGWAYAAPGLLGAGAVALLAPVSRTIGQALLFDGSVALVAVYVALWRRRPDDVVLVELLGAVAAACAAVLWMRLDVAELLPWLVAFIVLTIAAERVELARLHLPPTAGRMLVAGSVALVTTAAGSVLVPGPGTRILGGVLLVSAAWLARHDVARRLVRTRGLPRFSAAAMLGGYAWLAVAALGWLALGRPTGTRGYDLVVHATFLGFAMSMVLGHAAVILPAVIRRPLPYRGVFWVPLCLLHAALVTRVLAGDVAGLAAARVAGSIGTVVALVALPVTVIGLLAGGRPATRAGYPAGGPRARSTTGAS
jgi:hypothetical protein